MNNHPYLILTFFVVVPSFTVIMYDWVNIIMAHITVMDREFAKEFLISHIITGTTTFVINVYVCVEPMIHILDGSMDQLIMV